MQLVDILKDGSKLRLRVCCENIFVIDKSAEGEKNKLRTINSVQLLISAF